MSCDNAKQMAAGRHRQTSGDKLTGGFRRGRCKYTVTKPVRPECFPQHVEALISIGDSSGKVQSS